MSNNTTVATIDNMATRSMPVASAVDNFREPPFCMGIPGYPDPMVQLNNVGGVGNAEGNANRPLDPEELEFLQHLQSEFGNVLDLLDDERLRALFEDLKANGIDGLNDVNGLNDPDAVDIIGAISGGAIAGTPIPSDQPVVVNSNSEGIRTNISLHMDYTNCKTLSDQITLVSSKLIEELPRGSLYLSDLPDRLRFSYDVIEKEIRVLVRSKQRDARFASVKPIILGHVDSIKSVLTSLTINYADYITDRKWNSIVGLMCDCNYLMCHYLRTLNNDIVPMPSTATKLYFYTGCIDDLEPSAKQCDKSDSSDGSGKVGEQDKNDGHKVPEPNDGDAENLDEQEELEREYEQVREDFTDNPNVTLSAILTRNATIMRTAIRYLRID